MTQYVKKPGCYVKAAIIDPDKILILNMTNSPRFQMRLSTRIFLSILGITLLVWILRGVGLLTFLPGAIIWILILLSFVAGILNTLIRR